MAVYVEIRRIWSALNTIAKISGSDMCIASYNDMIKRLKIMIIIRGLTGKELNNG